MIYRTFGRSGWSVSEIGYGMWGLAGWTGADDREAAQTGSSGGDGDGQIEGQEGFAALRLAADDADRFLRPQVGDEPALLLGSIEESMSG